MRFRVLGPLEVDDLADPTALRRAKPRALLALLLLNANRPLSTDELIAALWGSRPPDRALGSLQNYVSQLRKALGPEVLVTRSGGYMLRVEPGELDLHVFERLCAEAAGAEAAVRAERLGAALSLWRGPPLPEFTYEAFAQDVIPRLEERRRGAIEALLEAKLDLGQAGELVGELESLVAQHPLHEHFRYLLMLALYRSGRQADALAAYQAARRYLADEVGLKPNEELQRLQRSILQQDPSIGPARPSERAMPVRPIRKPVTALVASVAPHEPHIDAEALRAVLGKVEPALRAAVETHGGSCDSFSSGELTAYFGVPAAHEDDALRAARAADAIRAGVRRINGDVDGASRMSVRIGFDSGEAVVEATSDGAVVTTAALPAARRLHERAADDEILLGAGAAVLVRGALVLERVHATADQDAFRLARLDVPAESAGFHSPLVGRRHELGRLEEELRRATTERACRVVTIVGEPGVGKSRVAAELAARAGGTARVLWGRCSAYGEGATFTPLADVVRETMGELEGDDEARTIAARLGGLTGLTDALVPTGDAFWAVRRFFERLAAVGPLLFVLEDAHWAEPTFLDLLEYLRDWTRDAPLLVVCTARPELLERRPSAGTNALVLGPLDRTDAASLARGLGVVDGELCERVVDAADGNPLFTEQLAAEVVARPDPALEPPASLEALLASRLDLLDAAERALVQRAATIGREFTRDALSHLTPPEERRTLESRLTALCRKGVVHRARGADAFSFHHGLTRDAAYASAPKRLRATLHERAAEWLGDEGADEVVGFHLEAAARYLGELGSADAASVAHRAGARLGRAGVRAFARADTVAAAALLRRAYELLPADDPRRFEAGCELATARFVLGRPDDAVSIAREVEAAAATAGERRFVVRARVERANVDVYRAPENVQPALELARAAIEELEQLQDERALGRAWIIRASIESGFLLANAAALDSIEHALVHYRRAGFPPSLPIGQFAPAAYFGPVPVERAIRRCAQLLADGDGGRNGDSTLRVGLAGLESFRGRFAEARQLLDLATSTLVEIGQSRVVVQWADPVRAEVERLAGDLRTAERVLRTACHTLERAREFAHLSTHAAEFARILYAGGNHEEADTWARTAEAHAGPFDVGPQFTWRSARAMLLAHAGEVDAAERLGREAIAIAEQTDALHQRAMVHLDLAEVLRLARKRDAALAEIHRAESLFRAKGSVAGLEYAARAAAELDHDERPPPRRPSVEAGRL